MADSKGNKPRPRSGRRRGTVGGTTQSGFAGGMSALISGQSSKAKPDQPKQEKAESDQDKEE
ncbi:MAG: hypothetical protein O2780_11385 [Proteobacteria bacterium]|jgi:hypothetical protein|nr:hypothetical protein [Pseudomonadota bacterium]MDA1302442.1 hypothetical protein [Pseudomonadota bacterium]